MQAGIGVEQFCKDSLDRVLQSLRFRSEDISVFEDLYSELCDAFRLCYLTQKRPHSLGIYNVDASLTFCVLLSRLLYCRGFKAISEMLYYHTRTTFACDIYPSRSLPTVFSLVHSLGTILGNAHYGNRLVFYQQVTIGGNPKLEYPIIGDDVGVLPKN